MRTVWFRDVGWHYAPHLGLVLQEDLLMNEDRTMVDVASGEITLFDEHGRCIPTIEKSGAHRKTRRRFSCAQPPVDYRVIHERIERAYKAHGAITAGEFEARSKAILDEIERDPATRPLARSVHVPFFLPHLPAVLSQDIGEQLDHVHIPAVERSFLAARPSQAFTRRDKEMLAGRQSIRGRSRHDRLLGALATGTVVGCYFLTLTEYSLNGAVDQVSRLPDKFLLAGGIDTCAALVGSPDLLINPGGYSPFLWMAALVGTQSAVSLGFEAYGANLAFDRRLHLDRPAEYWTCGIVVAG